MKTPEEIKRGLECYRGTEECDERTDCSECPYNTYTPDEMYQCAHIIDALAYIRRLEQDNAQKDERIRQLEQRVPRWISVHDALPGMDEKVLFIPACNPRSVYIGKLKYVGEVNAVYFVVNNWRRTVTYSATHWMPLPEPPEEGES